MTLRIVVYASTPHGTPRRTPDICRHSDGLEEVSEKHGATASQAALLWAIAQEGDVIASPGTARPPVCQTPNPGQRTEKFKPSPEGAQGVERSRIQ